MAHALAAARLHSHRFNRTSIGSLLRILNADRRFIDPAGGVAIITEIGHTWRRGSLFVLAYARSLVGVVCAILTVRIPLLITSVRHSAIWEQRWLQIIAAGRSFPGAWPEVPDAESVEEDATFRLTDDDTIETVVARYREQIGAPNAIMGSLDLDAPCARADLVNENLR